MANSSRFMLRSVMALCPRMFLWGILIAFGGEADTGNAAETAAGGESTYLFAYFKGNGEDGLHLARSEDGLHWRALNNDRSCLVPRVGQDKLMRDPSLILGPDGTFHMVWTVSWHERGIGYASSKDLMHWSEQRSLPVMEHEPLARNCWAPELFYDSEQQQFLILWATSIPGRFPRTDGQDASGGDKAGWNHRIYFVTTRDFVEFSPAALLYDQGFNVIDAYLVREGKRFAMFLKDETNRPFVPQKNIRIAFSDHAQGPYGPPSEAITGKEWAEGPCVLKVGSQWYLYFDQYRLHRYGLLVSSDFVHWTDRSSELIMPDGIRHGSALQVPAAIADQLNFE